MTARSVVYGRAMFTPNDIKEQLRAEMPHLRTHDPVDELGICGSVVRGEHTEERDVDLLVTFTDTPGLFTFIRLKRHLEEVLGCPVDLGMPDVL